MEKQIEKTAAEIERLKKLLEVERTVRRDTEAKLEKAEHDRDRYARAPIVHKMHSLIKERCIAGGIYPAVVARVVDEAAEEVMHEN